MSEGLTQTHCLKHYRLLRLRRQHYLLPPRRQMPVAVKVHTVIRRHPETVRRPRCPQAGSRRMAHNPRHGEREMARYSPECPASQTAVRLRRPHLRAQSFRLRIPRFPHPRKRAHPRAGGVPSVPGIRGWVHEGGNGQHFRPADCPQIINARSGRPYEVRPVVQGSAH